MINKKQITCKIDRVAATINFKLKKDENELLNDWSQSLNQILGLIDKTSNLIKREEELNA